MQVKETADGTRITLGSALPGPGNTLGGVILAGGFTLFAGFRWQGFLTVLDQWSHPSLRHPSWNPEWDTVATTLVLAIVVSLLALASWGFTIWSWFGRDILFLTPGEWRMWHGLGGLGWWRKIPPETVTGISLNPPTAAASARGGSLQVQAGAGRINLTIKGSGADQSWLRDRLQAAAGVGEIPPPVLTPLAVPGDHAPAAAASTAPPAIPATPAAMPPDAVPIQLSGWDLVSAPDGSIRLRSNNSLLKGLPQLVMALFIFGLAGQMMNSGQPASPGSPHLDFFMALIRTPLWLAGIGLLVGAVVMQSTRTEWVFSTDRLEIHTRRLRWCSTKSYSGGRLRLVKYMGSGTLPGKHALIIKLPDFTELKQEGADSREVRALGELIARHTGWPLEIPQYWAEAERTEAPNP